MFKNQAKRTHVAATKTLGLQRLWRPEKGKEAVFSEAVVCNGKGEGHSVGKSGGGQIRQTDWFM